MRVKYTTAEIGDKHTQVLYKNLKLAHVSMIISPCICLPTAHVKGRNGSTLIPLEKTAHVVSDSLIHVAQTRVNCIHQKILLEFVMQFLSRAITLNLTNRLFYRINIYHIHMYVHTLVPSASEIDESANRKNCRFVIKIYKFNKASLFVIII